MYTSTDQFSIAVCRIRRSASERKKRGSRPRESQGSPNSTSKGMAPGVDGEEDSKGLTSEPASDRGAMKHIICIESCLQFNLHAFNGCTCMCVVLIGKTKAGLKRTHSTSSASSRKMTKR